ncbi:GNAT family N-acetyltransferase [Bacillus sp. CMF12]|uniref:GNAT family N-acetyltransferase n=1 Tax=Bacillaceae TaxID=186817 RepID=UPI001FB202F3|nr:MULTISPECIES: GNAT family N-acetyltransferase [Bacillaceae]UOE53853.1 GNAT family N-acetyltransferase [Cytobacillus oceanisediminis]USK48305.1 GNAT family N-acetyltransferase [Bacillus sp. CMF12]
MIEEIMIDCCEIILREYRMEDVSALYEITLQPEVNEFIPGAQATLEQRINWMENYEIPANKKFRSSMPHLKDAGFLNLGIILKETGEFIGFCNTGIKDELPEPNREIGYAISKHYRNKGYSTLAAKGLMGFLFEKTVLETLNAVALTSNSSSIRVLQKCGFQLSGEMEIDGEQYFHYIIRKRDWTSNYKNSST